jgi:hypothetical protein
MIGHGNRYFRKIAAINNRPSIVLVTRQPKLSVLRRGSCAIV